MEFDTGTWWLVLLLIGLSLGVIEFLVVRTVFKQIDKHSADIEDIQKNYVPRTENSEELKGMRKETQNMVRELKQEFKQETSGIKESLDALKDDSVKARDFIREIGSLNESIKMLTRYVYEQGGKRNDDTR